MRLVEEIEISKHYIVHNAKDKMFKIVKIVGGEIEFGYYWDEDGKTYIINLYGKPCDYFNHDNIMYELDKDIKDYWANIISGEYV